MLSHERGPRTVATVTRAEVDAGQADRGHSTDAAEFAEVAVLGAAILSRDARAGIVERVQAEDFCREAHRTVFETVAAMHAEDGHVDHVTLIDRLASRGALDEVGGMGAMFDLTDPIACPHPAAWSVYAAIVAREGHRRRCIRRLRRAIDRLEAGEAPHEVLAWLEVAA